MSTACMTRRGASSHEALLLACTANWTCREMECGCHQLRVHPKRAGRMLGVHIANMNSCACRPADGDDGVLHAAGKV